MKRALVVAAGLMLALPALAEGVSLGDLKPAELDQLARRDLHQLKIYTLAASRLEREMDRHGSLFDKKKEDQLSPTERELAHDLFAQVMAYAIALDGMARVHGDYWDVSPLKQRTRHARHFAIHFAAYTQLHQLGLKFIDLTQGKPQFETLLDEGSPRNGTPPRAYERLKWNVVHVEDVSRLVAGHQYHKVLRLSGYPGLKGDTASGYAIANIDVTWPYVKSKLGRKGALLFAGNGVDILKDKSLRVWFPVQTGVAEWMGDTKYRRKGLALISAAQIQEAVKRSKPGDIVVERRNWYLSNVGLPGFWPHATLYLGSPKEMAAYLDKDPKVAVHYKGSFTKHLARKYPDAWATYTSNDEYGHTHRVLEAMSEGVVFTSAEHSFEADYVGALRPKLSKLEKAQAIERAFGYAFRPYDFNFDFFSDTTIVCSELVYKAYEPRKGVTGLSFPLERVVGRMTLSPNTMIRQWAESGAEHMKFAWFLDGREKTKDAAWATEEDLRLSHLRPKWDVAQR
jgi:hypothetical protein